MDYQCTKLKSNNFNKVIIFLIVVLSIGFINSEGEFAYNNLQKPTLTQTYINYTKVNVNNSYYWDGHIWSEVSNWLYNQSLSPVNIFDQTLNTVDDVNFNRINWLIFKIANGGAGGILITTDDTRSCAGEGGTVAIGGSAGASNGDGGCGSSLRNVFIGAETAINSNTSIDNVLIGYRNGMYAGSGNVQIGSQVGSFGDNKLAIDNSNTATPLIYGDFANDYVTINGALNATGGITGASTYNATYDTWAYNQSVGSNPFNQSLNKEDNVQFNNITSTGNISAVYFIGDGTYITNVQSSDYWNETGNQVWYVGDGNVTADMYIGDDVFIGDDISLEGDLYPTNQFKVRSNVLPQFAIVYNAAPTFNLTVSSQGYFNINAPTGTNQYKFDRNGVTQFKVDEKGNVDIGNANANLTFGGFNGAGKISFQEVRSKIINLYQNANFHYGFGIPTITGGYALRTYMPDSATNRFDWSFLSTADGTTDKIKMWLNNTELYVNNTARIEEDLIVNGNVSYPKYYAQAYYHNYTTPVTISIPSTDTYYPINNFTMNGNYGFIVSGNGVNTTKSGLYSIDLRIAVDGLNNGDYELDLFVNGTEVEECSTFVSTSTGFHQPVSFGCIQQLNAGSSLDVRVADRNAPSQNLDYHSLNFRIFEV